MKTVKAAIYARVSTRDKGQDPENQLRELRAYCERAGWEIFGEYIDHVSGKSGDRDEFKGLFEDARLKRFDLVYFWSLDRFSREGALPTLGYLQTLTNYGVGWRSHTEQYLDSTGIFKDAVISILATIAKQERERHRERMRAAMDRAKAEGREIGRKKRIFNREYAAELYAAGKSVRQIANELGIGRGTAHRAIKQFGSTRPKMDQIKPLPLVPFLGGLKI